jgi:hypothetical protein
VTDQRHAVLIRQLQGAVGGALSWVAFVPAWTGASNPAIGNGTLNCFYRRLGDLVIATWNVVAGSTTTFGSGQYNLDLPVPARSGQRWALTGDLLDAGTQHYEVVAIINGGSVFEEILAMSNAAGPTNWAATSPFTFGSGDRITLSGMYAAA